MSKRANSYNFCCFPVGDKASKKVHYNCWQDAKKLFKKENVAIPGGRYDYLISDSQCYPHLL